MELWGTGNKAHRGGGRLRGRDAVLLGDEGHVLVERLRALQAWRVQGGAPIKQRRAERYTLWKRGAPVLRKRRRSSLELQTSSKAAYTTWVRGGRVT